MELRLLISWLQDGEITLGYLSGPKYLEGSYKWKMQAGERAREMAV